MSPIYVQHIRSKHTLPLKPTKRQHKKVAAIMFFFCFVLMLLAYKNSVEFNCRHLLFAVFFFYFSLSKTRKKQNYLLIHQTIKRDCVFKGGNKKKKAEKSFKKFLFEIADKNGGERNFSCSTTREKSFSIISHHVRKELFV